MEKNLDRIMEQILSNTDILGCIFTDKQGLCIGAKGRATPESAGYIAAIANQVAKLEPNKETPIITLENDNQKCIIQNIGPITGAIYKNI
ncbi:late endosomal/lysosomal adaptor, MAPK and MTOR activator 5 [Rhynchophorus ferrugineus]|uniref:Late endosomal/lysosomal adaptor and MAPK and MTOR activator 5 n=1 Tax=Rhynchophorus ferrugineus TaxID=354439 RepID=A0A834I2F5_RHYFE|nr:hypothetical protein GWI33_020805 [Rhynchophorus ferrugineus]